MGFLDELKKMTRPYDDDDEFFDDEDEAIPVAEAPAPERPAPARPARRTAPAAKQSSFIRDDPVSEPVREPERPAPVVVAEGENDREGDDEDWRNVELPEGVTLR